MKTIPFQLTEGPQVRLRRAGPAARMRISRQFAHFVTDPLIDAEQDMEAAAAALDEVVTALHPYVLDCDKEALTRAFILASEDMDTILRLMAGGAA